MRRALYLERRSHRHFVTQPIGRRELGELLGCLGAIRLDGQPKYRYGSAGSLYPVQTYLHLKPERVEEMPAGAYYYDPDRHRLVSISPGVEIDPQVHAPFVNRPIFEQAAFSVFLVAELAAISPLYGERSLHYATIEAGLMSQLLETTAAAQRIGLCQIGDLDFERLRPLFSLGDSQVLVHSLVGGRVSAEQQRRWVSWQQAEQQPDVPREEFIV